MLTWAWPQMVTGTLSDGEPGVSPGRPQRWEADLLCLCISYICDLCHKLGSCLPVKSVANKQLEHNLHNLTFGMGQTAGRAYSKSVMTTACTTAISRSVIYVQLKDERMTMKCVFDI